MDHHMLHSINGVHLLTLLCVSPPSLPSPTYSLLLLRTADEHPHFSGSIPDDINSLLMGHTHQHMTIDLHLESKKEHNANMYMYIIV